MSLGNVGCIKFFGQFFSKVRFLSQPANVFGKERWTFPGNRNKSSPSSGSSAA